MKIEPNNIVRIVFSDERYLYNLIGEVSEVLECKLLYVPQDTGDMFVFEYKGKVFQVNPEFSGFMGISQ